MKLPATSTPLRDEIENTSWYHTIDFPGIATTKGFFDLRRTAERALPDDLSGQRCLDACTASGFWAFEMEKRGATETVAIDVRTFAEQDWQKESSIPPGDEAQRLSFDLARRALQSEVIRHDLSVYDVRPELIGTFDFAFMGAVLIHLSDPVRALRAIRTVMKPGGEFRSLDVVLLRESVLRGRVPRGRFHTGDGPRWWTPNVAAHRRWLESAGFEVVRSEHFVFERYGALHNQTRIRGLSPRARAHAAYYRHVGVPCQLLVCRVPTAS